MNDDSPSQHQEDDNPEEWLEDNGLLEEAERSARRIKAYLYTDRFLRFTSDDRLTLLDVIQARARKAKQTVAAYVSGNEIPTYNEPLAIRVTLNKSSYDRWPLAKGDRGWAVMQRVLQAVGAEVTVRQ